MQFYLFVLVMEKKDSQLDYNVAADEVIIIQTRVIYWKIAFSGPQRSLGSLLRINNVN